MEIKNSFNDRWYAEIDVDLFKASALLSVPFDEKKGQVSASFRCFYYELLLFVFIDENVYLRFIDYQLRLTYDVSASLRAKLLFLGVEDVIGWWCF